MTENMDDEALLFSSKRIFINNVDSYHGEFIHSELKKLLNDSDVESPVNTSQELVGEDAEVAPPAPSQYEIIGRAVQRHSRKATVLKNPAAQWAKHVGAVLISTPDNPTASDPKINHIEFVSNVISKDDCFDSMLCCGYVVFDITIDSNEVKSATNYLNLVKKLLDKPSEEADSSGNQKRYLILISTVMTWALTKPLDPDAPEMPFLETDFRKRRPHPSYKEHHELENKVLAAARKYKDRFRGLVLSIGVTYGGREDVLGYWFQKAWENEPVLPILGRGNNTVPLINIRDVATIVYNLVTNFPVKLYIVGVEQTITKQKQIVKSIGRRVGTGMFKCIQKEDGFLVPEISQRVYDYMTLNINMEPTFIVETMLLQWVNEASFVENIASLIKHYKKEKALRPFKVILHGPPAVGKTTLAKQICETYGLPYLSPDTIVQDLIDDLAWRVAHYAARELAMAAGEGGGALAHEDTVEEEEDEESQEGRAECARQLALLQAGRPLSDHDLIGYMRKRMACHEALNKGWVLDGSPSTVELCATLHENGEDVIVEEEEEEDDEKFEEDINLYENVVRQLLPDIVVSLEASDEFICEKMMRQAEDVVRGTQYEEVQLSQLIYFLPFVQIQEVLVRRLADFRANNMRDVTPLNFYDELDIHPLVVVVADHADYAMSTPYAEVTLRMGKPCRYGKLVAIIEEAEKKEKAEVESLRKKKIRAQKELEQRMLEDRQDKMEYWSELYAQVKEEEEAALAVASEPLRTYLVNHILPTLTEGLLEVATVRPEDPIDYLAEYLFKLNPTGKMLEPGYNLQAELFFNKIRLLDQSLHDLDIVIDPLEAEPASGSHRARRPSNES